METKLQGRLGVLSARASNGATAELFSYARGTHAPGAPIHYSNPCALCHLLPKLLLVTDSTGIELSTVWGYVLIYCKIFLVVCNTLTGAFLIVSDAFVTIS
jgi:hypothetical protein